MEAQINQFIEEFKRDNDDVKTVAVLDKTGLPLNNSQFSKESIPYLKFMSDNARNLKMSPGDADPVVTVFTQNEQIIVKSYGQFILGVKKGRGE